MIYSIIYTNPDAEIKKPENIEIVRTNSRDIGLNARYCFMRADCVILGENAEKEKKFCDWFKLLTFDTTDKILDVPITDTRYAFAGEFSREKLNELFKIFRDSDFNFVFFSPEEDSVGNRMAKALMKAKKDD